MEVSQVLGARGRWDTYMPVFANLLRPSSAADPVVDLPVHDSEAINDSITAFRNSSDGEALKIWGDQIVTLVFDGYAEWASYYSAQPDWVLTNLAQVLADAGQQSALLQHLHNITDALPEARADCLLSFKNDIDLWAPGWHHDAHAAPAADHAVQAYPNTDSWNYSRTPGTFYYKYLERDGEHVYVYNDHEHAADQDWHELKHWDNLAEAEARKPENKLTTKFPDWDASWAAWSVLDYPEAEGGRVYGKADEGRWYDYDGAIEAHHHELAAQAQAQAQAPPSQDPADAPLLKLAQDVHEDVLVPLTEQIMRNLPPELAGKEGIDALVRRYVRDDISRRIAALGGQEGDSAR